MLSLRRSGKSRFLGASNNMIDERGHYHEGRELDYQMWIGVVMGLPVKSERIAAMR
jgi:hypothetical protein